MTGGAGNTVGPGTHGVGHIYSYHTTRRPQANKNFVKLALELKFSVAASARACVKSRALGLIQVDYAES